MAVQPTLIPRATALWERQGGDPIGSFLSDLFGAPTNTDSIASSATSTSTRSSSSSTTTRRTTSSTSSTPTTSSTSSTSSTFTTSSTTSSSTSSTPTSTSTTSSASSTVITTSSPSTLVTTSNFVSGTSTSQVVVTTVVTPVVTTTSSPNRSDANRSSVNGGLIGGVVGGVVGGLALLALLIAVCVMASRRRSRTGHAYFLCFGERPSRNKDGDLGHSGGAWPTFDPQNDHVPLSHAAGGAGGAGVGAAAVGAGAAAGSRNRRHRRDQTNATLPVEFANDQDPERYGYTASSHAHAASYQDYQGYDAYNAYGANTYPDMQERPARNGASALAAGAAAGGAGAYLYNNASPASHNRRSSAGHPSYGASHEAYDGYNTATMSPQATTSTETAPAPWTLPMMGWQDTHGPYSVAGVGQNLAGAGAGPQAQFMVSPSEANAAAAAAAAARAPQRSPPLTRSPGPDYSHFDPPEVRDARAREAAAAALGRGSFSTSNSHGNSGMPTSPRRQSRRLSSNHGSPVSDHVGLNGGMGPPAYVDAQDALEEVDEHPRRLHLTNAEPDATDDDSSRGGPNRRPAHNHIQKDRN
ncbi:uncharacterized protein SRS1_15096 [Sporisorium reilianum f. sp. reilianum]|uniref:Uncharacterized protein n=1 Tax=Sporisorium reilianum f. sp. reilianum TaxID=72559 RepID=A0A2N8UHN4_9BASI|nr:uncharacterized protein SRS1_15096 [Sporisorium reilianum f. sp. reilianum]